MANLGMKQLGTKRLRGGVTGLKWDKYFFIFQAPTCLEFGFDFDLCSVCLFDMLCFVLFFLGSDRVYAPDKGCFFAVCCLLLGSTGFSKFGPGTGPGLSITLVSYMDGTRLGTVMAGVWFLSDCSLLFLIIR